MGIIYVFVYILACGVGSLVADVTPGVRGPGPIAFAVTFLIAIAVHALIKARGKGRE